MEKKTRSYFLMLLISFLVASGPAWGQSAPQEDNDYTRIPFGKAISPAFSDTYANKWVCFKAKFVSQVSTVMDLPNEYRKRVRFMVMDAEGGTGHSMNLVISKEKSDPIFDLRNGEVIEIFAYSLPLKTASGITHRAQSSLLFRVEKIVKV